MTASRSKRGRVPPATAPSPDRAVRQVNFRLSTEVWERLDAIASVRNQPQSRIVADALTLLYDTLVPAERALTDQLLKHRRKPDSR